MAISAGRSLVIILLCAACTQLERALPFLFFASRPVPPVIRYLGRILPMAVMTTLVIYCLRQTTFSSWQGFAPQGIAVALTAALHWWKRNTLLSIFCGTVCYMLLVQLVF